MPRDIDKAAIASLRRSIIKAEGFTEVARSLLPMLEDDSIPCDEKAVRVDAIDDNIAEQEDESTTALKKRLGGQRGGGGFGFFGPSMNIDDLEFTQDDEVAVVKADGAKYATRVTLSALKKFTDDEVDVNDRVAVRKAGPKNAARILNEFMEFFNAQADMAKKRIEVLTANAK